MTLGPRRVFLIAGEPSGDRLGAALMRGLREEAAERGAPAPEFLGVGGAAMAAEGMESLFPISDIAVMGLTEVAPALRRILARLSQTVEAVTHAAPDVVVTIDAPDFCKRVARRARPILGARTVFVHYVAPSVWAWRPKRAAKLAQTVDHLLALLPFEPPYFHREGLSCDFVGHPVVETVSKLDPDPAAARAELGLPAAAPLLAVLPGSRRGEVARLGEVFGATVARLVAARPDLEVVVPAAEHVVERVSALAADWAAPSHVIDPRGRSFAEAERRKLLAMAASDAALAASGTVSLELAAMGAPMVIAYRASPITAAIVRRLLKIDTATLVNLVSETRAVPEFFQENAQPALLAEALSPLFEREGAAAAAQRSAARETMRRLGAGDAPPSRRAARSVWAAWERRQTADATT